MAAQWGSLPLASDPGTTRYGGNRQDGERGMGNKLIPMADATKLVMRSMSCTCHTDDKPPVCQHRYAVHECLDDIGMKRHLSQRIQMIGKTTQYGFDWGPMQVQRACSDERYHTLLIQTKHWDIQLSVSPTGKAVHFSKQKRSTSIKEAK